VLIGAEPGFAVLEPATNVALVVVEDYAFAIDSTDKLGRGHLHFYGFVTWDAGDDDCDSPK
jgi:hypothetical protein